MPRTLTDFTLYKWRFVIGYSIVGLTVAILVYFAAFYVPGGLNSFEQQSAISSNSLTIAHFKPEMIIDAPYGALQKLSLYLFGLSPISIKLPSIILGSLSIIGIFALLSFWFRRNVAVLTTILIIATGQLLFLTQQGTADITGVFWSVILLLSATLVARQIPGRPAWMLTFGAAAALSLYTPLSIYVLIALAIAAFLHPHLRITVHRLHPAYIFIGLFGFALLVAPLVYAIVLEPQIGLQLLGVPLSWPPDWHGNLITLANQYIDFISPDNTRMMGPIYGIASLILIVIGIIRLVTTKYTARSYLITIWGALLIPVMVLNPLATGITFVPILILMGMALETLLHGWYRLFPRNPYARFVGLVPLTIFIGGLILSGAGRYLYGYHYDPLVARNFSTDLRLIKTELQSLKGQPVILVVGTDEASFYDLLRKTNKDLVVTTTKQASTAPTIVTRSAATIYPTRTVSRIITDRMSTQANRLYIYNLPTK